MKNKQPTPSILLDTSFILPTLGINVGTEVSKGLKKLDETNAKIYYSQFSILESLWITSRFLTSQTFNEERFKIGLKSIMKADRYTKVDENPEIFNEALRLQKLGHKDMIDNILYSTSLHLNLKLLTLDTQLKKFIGDKGPKDTLISPNQITKPL